MVARGEQDSMCTVTHCRESPRGWRRKMTWLAKTKLTGVCPLEPSTSIAFRPNHDAKEGTTMEEIARRSWVRRSVGSACAIYSQGEGA